MSNFWGGGRKGTLWETRKWRICTKTISETGQELYLANIWSAFLENEWRSVWSQVRRRSRYLRQEILVELLEVKTCLPQPTTIFFPTHLVRSLVSEMQSISLSFVPVINHLVQLTINRIDQGLSWNTHITQSAPTFLVQIDRIRHFLDKQRPVLNKTAF